MAADLNLTQWLAEVVQGHIAPDLNSMTAMSPDDLETLSRLAFQYPLSHHETLTWSLPSRTKADFIEAFQERILDRPERALQLRLRLGLEVELPCPGLDTRLTLAVAISVGRVEVVDRLLKVYPELNKPRCLEKAVLCALAFGQQGVYRQLVGRGAPSCLDSDNIDLAIRGGCLELVGLFPIPDLESLQEEYLPMAAQSGSVPLMEHLLGMLGEAVPDWEQLYLVSLDHARPGMAQFLRSRAGLSAQRLARLHQQALSEALDQDNTDSVVLLVNLGARASEEDLATMGSMRSVKLYRRLTSN